MSATITRISSLASDGIDWDSIRLMPESSAIVTYTETEESSARAFWSDKTKENKRGRLPLEAWQAWVAAGRPIVSAEELRKERLAVQEITGRKWQELTAEEYADAVATWERRGKFEPERFLRDGIAAKIYAYPLRDGVPDMSTDETIEIYREVLDSYRAEHGLKGRTATEVYLEFVPAGFSAYKLVTPNKTYNFDGDGNTLTPARSTALKLEETEARLAAMKAEIAANPADALEILKKYGMA